MGVSSLFLEGYTPAMSANCDSCGQTNLADARFCSAFGSALAALADVVFGIVGENLRPAT